MSDVSSHSSARRSAPSRLRPLTLLTLLLLNVEFFIGMLVNLYVQIPVHPGTGSANYFLGAVQGIGWALAFSPLALFVHVVLGLLLGLASFTLIGFAIASRRLSWIIPSILGWIGIVGAGFNGASFLNYGHDLSSLLMSTGFVLAIISYTLGFALASKREAHFEEASSS
ncbi:MAG TPA: hypothetical protein VFV38_35680 [Ktedonobacteraceae bacterium]|nr:hypothetical protein [Ktedonobacteraceae bacterium]